MLFRSPASCARPRISTPASRPSPATDSSKLKLLSRDLGRAVCVGCQQENKRHRTWGKSERASELQCEEGGDTLLAGSPFLLRPLMMSHLVCCFCSSGSSEYAGANGSTARLGCGLRARGSVCGMNGCQQKREMMIRAQRTKRNHAGDDNQDV